MQGDCASLARVLTRLTNVLRNMADPTGAMAVGQEALTLATALSNVASQIEAAYYLGLAYYTAGDFRRAAELLHWAVAVQQPGVGRPAYGLRSRAWLALALSALGQFAEGRRYGEEALRLATVEDYGDNPIIAYGCLGFLLLDKGDVQAAISILNQGLTLCRTADDRAWGRPIAANLGYASALIGHLAAGRALLEEACREGLSTGALIAHSRYVVWLSAISLLTGHVDEAWQHADRALALARQHGERWNEALALCQLGLVHAYADPPAAIRSEALYRKALALANELGMRPLVAHCHHGLGRLYSQMGQVAQARSALTTAIEMYRAMDMTFYLTQAEAALAEGAER